MPCLAILWARIAGRPVAAPTPAAATQAQSEAEAPGVAADAPCGCGWFESSHELQQGLRVFEDEVDLILAV
jgi:hypothetical protein